MFALSIIIYIFIQNENTLAFYWKKKPFIPTMTSLFLKQFCFEMIVFWLFCRKRLFMLLFYNCSYNVKRIQTTCTFILMNTHTKSRLHEIDAMKWWIVFFSVHLSCIFLTLFFGQGSCFRKIYFFDVAHIRKHFILIKKKRRTTQTVWTFLFRI